MTTVLKRSTVSREAFHGICHDTFAILHAIFAANMKHEFGPPYLQIHNYVSTYTIGRFAISQLKRKISFAG